MTVNEAIKRAKQDPEGSRIIYMIDQLAKVTAHSPCLIFAIGDETFYYGFDGVDFRKGKHNAKRSRYLIETDQCLVIK